MDADPAFARTSASDDVVAGSDGTRASEFKENESDSEPSNSISGLIDVTGASVQREDKDSKFPFAPYVYHKKKR